MQLRPGELARFDRATGVRPEKLRREETVVPNDSERCTKRACDCAAVRAEREELLLQRDELRRLLGQRTPPSLHQKRAFPPPFSPMGRGVVLLRGRYPFLDFW